MIDATSFETEENLLLKLEWFKKRKMYTKEPALFFDPSGGTLYAEHGGTLSEWELGTNEPGPKWWIGE